MKDTNKVTLLCPQDLCTLESLSYHRTRCWTLLAVVWACASDIYTLHRTEWSTLVVHGSTKGCRRIGNRSVKSTISRKSLSPSHSVLNISCCGLGLCERYLCTTSYWVLNVGITYMAARKAAEDFEIEQFIFSMDYHRQTTLERYGFLGTANNGCSPFHI